MNYLVTYNKLIQHRRDNLIVDGYCEMHHIVPRSEGGSNDESNLVKLTAREHFIAHLLLAKIYDDIKMHYALNMMTVKSRNHQRTFKITSRQYEYIRKMVARKQSEHYKSKENHPMFGRHHTDESKRKNSESHKGSKNPRYGKHYQMSAETKAKLSASLKGRKISDEQKAKQSERMRGRKASEETKQKLRRTMTRLRGKKIGKFTFDGQLVEEYESIKEAAKANDVSHVAISFCCSGKHQSCKGYVFKYIGEQNG